MLQCSSYTYVVNKSIFIVTANDKFSVRLHSYVLVTNRPSVSIVPCFLLGTKMENFQQERSQSESPKLVVFKAIRRNFAVIGIGPELATQTYPINRKIFIGFLALCLVIASLLAYISNDAETFADYTQSIYVCSIAVLITFALAFTISNAGQLFDFINICNSVANTSTCKSM